MSKTKDLYSATYLAEALDVTRKTIHKAIESGRVEAPAYHVVGAGEKAPIAAWTREQVGRIKRAWKPGSPGRPPKG